MGANIERLEDAIIKTGDINSIILFANEIDGADIKRLTNVILETGDIGYISTFFRVVYHINIHSFEELEIINVDEIIEQRCRNRETESIKVKRKHR